MCECARARGVTVNTFIFVDTAAGFLCAPLSTLLFCIVHLGLTLGAGALCLFFYITVHHVRQNSHVKLKNRAARIETLEGAGGVGGGGGVEGG